MRRVLLIALACLLPVPALAASEGKLSIGAGDAVFWTGPHIDEGGGGPWTYKLNVKEPGYRLRIGIDHPEIGDRYDVRLTKPDGGTATFTSGDGLYSGEYLEENPDIGTWTIVVTPATVTDSNFRVRAKLEAQKPSLGVKKGPVKPNLQVLPPHEASFLMPVSNGALGGDPVGLDLLGAESCHPEEHAEETAVRCLRFAFGIRNTGLGPLQLFESGTMGMDHPLIQRLQLAEDGFIEREAGIARYHKTHAHYHHHDAVALQLFKVVDEKTGALEPAGEKHFKGFAHRSELLREWDVFYPTWPHQGFGLDAGWADIYEWDRPGNYIDFGLNGDGLYVIRMWADPVRGVVESNERDNAGYTYLRVTGSEVELIEAGRGQDPWDPCKIEVGFGGHPDPRQPPRPRGCAADTV